MATIHCRAALVFLFAIPWALSIIHRGCTSPSIACFVLWTNDRKLEFRRWEDCNAVRWSWDPGGLACLHACASTSCTLSIAYQTLSFIFRTSHPAFPLCMSRLSSRTCRMLLLHVTQSPVAPIVSPRVTLNIHRREFSDQPNNRATSPLKRFYLNYPTMSEPSPHLTRERR